MASVINRGGRPRRVYSIQGHHEPGGWSGRVMAKDLLGTVVGNGVPQEDSELLGDKIGTPRLAW